MACGCIRVLRDLLFCSFEVRTLDKDSVGECCQMDFEKVAIVVGNRQLSSNIREYVLGLEQCKTLHLTEEHSLV